jgi:5-methylcytosine-specific restriction protein B
LQPWIAAIRRKGQAIFYGPPGTGKTRLAQHIARHLVGGGDGFVDLVQFHAAYQYEDFVQGLRPVPHEGGGLSYELVPGRFLAFCREAAARTGPCVLIIDEINRADLSRVFGELMYLLEYRERTIPLATGGQFSIPANVLIIGTMNTADRSIALVDHALRRRFAFIALRPNYELLRRYHQDRQPGIAVDRLVTLLREINEAIGDPNYELGITYFLRPHLGDVLRDVWQMEIEPYLEEFFFDRPEDVDPFRWEQVQARLEKSTDEHGIS